MKSASRTRIRNREFVPNFFHERWRLVSARGDRHAIQRPRGRRRQKLGNIRTLLGAIERTSWMGAERTRITDTGPSKALRHPRASNV